MKKKLNPRSAFANPRSTVALVLCLTGVFIALGGLGFYPQRSTAQARNGLDRNPPWVVPMIGPVSQNLDLRALPYVAPKPGMDERRLTRYPLPLTAGPQRSAALGSANFQSIRQFMEPPRMPAPLLTFDGMNSVQSGCGCLPPDTNGDVGPNHYVESVNTSIKIFDKIGTPLNGTNGTTYNSFFAALGPSTPCGAQNDGDGFVLYDHLADRWLVSDFAFPSFPGTSFYQCIGVSKTANPVTGGWWLYAIQIDRNNPAQLGDYPKFALWPDAYYLTVNLFSNGSTFNGVRVFALPRLDMINGNGAPNINAIAFTIDPSGLGDSYSLVPAMFRTGTAPPAGRDEYLLSVDSPATGGVTLTQVHVWRFHVDFGTPANSTLGVGANHAPNGNVTVNGFVDAFTTTTNLVPQNGTTALLDTLGDKIMTPVVYQNLSGVESLWASQTILLNYPSGPTAVRWYQFDVTGSTIPATPVQQQDWNNNADGLWRWMPSIAVDSAGNMAIGYSTSSADIEPSIRYAGRFAGDPANDLAQGEAIMTEGGGHQTSGSGRWGDYSAMSIDPSDNLSFWHANEYYSTTSGAGWSTRIGKFVFGTPTPTPSPTPTPRCSPTITHSTSQTIIPGNSINCNDGMGHHTDSSYWRAFNMTTFTNGEEYDISAVTFGVQQIINGSNNGQALTINLYANNGGAFPAGTRTLLNSVTLNPHKVTNQSGTIINVPVKAAVPAGTGELVVEVFSPDGRPDGNTFYIGSNLAAQTGPSYFNALDCGISDPTDLASLGFSDMHIVINVRGTCPTPPAPGHKPKRKHRFRH